MAHTDRQPSNALFEDMRQAALKVWSKYDDTYGYQTEKTTQVKAATNYADNWWTFFGMMDSTNQAELLTHLELKETREFLAEQSVYYSAILG